MSARQQGFTVPSSRAQTSGSAVLDDLIGMPGRGEEQDAQPDLAAVPAEEPTSSAPSTPPPSKAPPGGTAPRSRRQTKQSTSAPPAEPAEGSAQQAVDASFRSARLNPRDWTTLSLRLPAELQQRLTERMVIDREDTGRPTLAVSHYINAALTTIPTDPDIAASWAQDYIDKLGGRSLDAPNTGTRVQRDTRAAVRHIEGKLRIRRFGLFGYMLAATVERFMDQLDAERTNGDEQSPS